MCALNNTPYSERDAQIPHAHEAVGTTQATRALSRSPTEEAHCKLPYWRRMKLHAGHTLTPRKGKVAGIPMSEESLTPS